MTIRYQERCISGNGLKFCRDVKIIADKIAENWWRKEGHLVDAGDVTDILAAHPDVLVVNMAFPPYS